MLWIVSFAHIVSVLNEYVMFALVVKDNNERTLGLKRAAPRVVVGSN